MHPLLIEPKFALEKVQLLRQVAAQDPIFLSDFADDIGLPKGTSVWIDTLLPYSMGNEAYDGFLVIELPAGLENRVLHSWNETANDMNHTSATFCDGHSTVVANILDVTTQLDLGPVGIGQSGAFPLLSHSHRYSSWHRRAASTLSTYLLGSLGHLRSDSRSKYVELCRDDASAYLVVHGGVGNFSSKYLALVTAIVRSKLGIDLIGSAWHSDRFLGVRVSPDTDEFHKLAWLNDVSRRLAWTNRMILANRFLLGALDGCRTLFHSEHASIERTEGGFMHANSLNVIRSDQDYGFISGKNGNYLFPMEDGLRRHGFYPHRIDPEEDAHPTADKSCMSSIDILRGQGLITKLTRMSPVVRYKVS